MVEDLEYSVIRKNDDNENLPPNFDKLTKNNVFTKPLISKHRANHKRLPMYIKDCKSEF